MQRYRGLLVVAVVACFSFALMVGLAQAQTGGLPRGPTGDGGPGPVGAGFVYQGQLENAFGPVTGNCDFQFSLWDRSDTGTPPTGGLQIGATETQTNVAVTDGLFSVVLNFTQQLGRRLLRAMATGYRWSGERWGREPWNLSKSSGSFKIDHPLEPENQYLYHSFVESPDMKNIYDGVVVLDKHGKAVVTLPDWFEALNGDFRYQLACVGGYAPVYVAEEIHDNAFKIADGKPGLKVSWQITGIRDGPLADDHRIPVEEDKPLEEQGTYLYPAGYELP